MTTIAPNPARRDGTHRVVFLTYEGIWLLETAGPLEAFCLATMHVADGFSRAAYECRVVSIDGGPVRTAGGMTIETERASVLDGQPIDTLIVPGAADRKAVTSDRNAFEGLRTSTADTITRDPRMIDWLRTRAPDCGRISSVCSGAFALAAAGLLRGRRAVTHWLLRDDLRSLHPEIEVEPDAIYIRDGKVWTAAGVSSGIDLALALIEEDLGRSVSLAVARLLIVYLRRMGGHSQCSALLAAQVESAGDRFSELERWISENVTADLRVERLAARVGMSPRNFARLYTQKRGRTPASTVEILRVEAARRALEETDDRMDCIARRCGFSDEKHLRQAFARQLGIAPRDYRRHFTDDARSADSNDGTDVVHVNDPMSKQVAGRSRSLIDHGTVPTGARALPDITGASGRFLDDR